MSKYEELVEQKVIAVTGSTLFLESGLAWAFVLDGDCCSSSDFTSDALTAFQELVGATIKAVEDRDGSSAPEVEAKFPEGDVLLWHFVVVTTDKGHVTLDWRNDSNGYYDGSCGLAAAAPMHPVDHDAILEGRGKVSP